MDLQGECKPGRGGVRPPRLAVRPPRVSPGSEPTVKKLEWEINAG